MFNFIELPLELWQALGEEEDPEDFFSLQLGAEGDAKTEWCYLFIANDTDWAPKPGPLFIKPNPDDPDGQVRTYAWEKVADELSIGGRSYAAYELNLQDEEYWQGRGWWDRLHRMSPEKQIDFIIQAYRLGVINDYGLWGVLGYHSGPVSYRDAVEIYEQLGFKPHSGYPLTPA